MKKLTRVRVRPDHYPEDPREDRDLMCEIVCLRSRSYEFLRLTAEEELMRLVTLTDGWRAACKLSYAAGADDPDLYDKDILDQWVALLDATELKVHEFSTSSENYIAHTTPELCAKLGVDWANAQQAMESEVEMFKLWADGDVWGVEIQEATLEEGQEEDDLDDDAWETVDSCWGFYGLDNDNGMRDIVPQKLWPQLDDAMESPSYA